MISFARIHAIICELYFDRNIMTRFKSSFLCSLFTSSCSFHFLCTLSSYANRKNAYRIRLSHLDSQFVATIRSGNFERRLKIKMGRIVLKWKTARGANVFFGKFALSKIDSTRVSETAFQFERKAHPLRSRCIEFVSIRPNWMLSLRTRLSCWNWNE